MLFQRKGSLKIRIGIALCGLCIALLINALGLFPSYRQAKQATPVMLVATTAGIAGVYLIAGPLPALAIGLGLSFAGCGGGGGGGNDDLGEPPAPPSTLLGQR